MLRTLEIRDMLIIDRLELGFRPGLNVLTGETGAGKSILLDSLGFVLGWRGRAELVRAGADQGEVIAEFDLAPGHPAFAILLDAGLPVDDTLILRRINTVDGRKTAWVNDRRCSGEVLRRLSETLIELHGQHDDRGLLNPRGHRAILDAYARHDDVLSTCRSAWRARSVALTALEQGEASLAEMRAEEDFLRHAVAELDALDPTQGEDAALDARRRLMQGAERIRDDIARAATALGIDGAEGQVNDALRWLDGVADKAEGQLDEALLALGRTLVELDGAARNVADCLDALAFDARDLEETEERLFAIRALARKHNVAPDELGEFANGLRARLVALDQGDGDVAALRATLATAHKAYVDISSRLSENRRAAALRLDCAVSDELTPLKMERAVFTTQLSDAPAGPEGTDAVTFEVATNPGAPSGPLAKIASGGELSRFLLALKVCLVDEQAGLTMIFDEIDRGVGGATADAVGRRLEQLASDGQVLVVTHSPQVAALAKHHWRVEKQTSSDETLSRVVALDASARVDEIARMLSGDRITDEARAAANALMAG